MAEWASSVRGYLGCLDRRGPNLPKGDSQRTWSLRGGSDKEWWQDRRARAQKNVMYVIALHRAALYTLICSTNSSRFNGGSQWALGFGRCSDCGSRYFTSARLTLVSAPHVDLSSSHVCMWSRTQTVTSTSHTNGTIICGLILRVARQNRKKPPPPPPWKIPAIRYYVFVKTPENHPRSTCGVQQTWILRDLVPFRISGYLLCCQVASWYMRSNCIIGVHVVQSSTLIKSSQYKFNFSWITWRLRKPINLWYQKNKLGQTALSLTTREDVTAVLRSYGYN